MATIRALRRDDLPAVADLVERELARGVPGEGEAFLADVALGQPWFDPEVPSLVAEGEDGSVLGFLAAHPRRLRLGRRDVRAVVCSHLVVEPSARTGALGVQLLSRFLAGPQDLSFSDTAIEVVARAWRAAGGRIDGNRSHLWMRPLAPARWLAFGAMRSVVGRSRAAGLCPVRPRPLSFRPPPAETRLASAPLTSTSLVAEADAVLGDRGLRTAWDEAYAAWLLRTVEQRFGAGRVSARMVQRGGTAIGWYVYARGPSRQGKVLQLAARRREIDAVVGELFAAACGDGLVVLTGRVEPHLIEPLRARGCAVGLGPRPVVHARDPELLAALGSPDSLLSWLDGEFWA